MPTSSDSDKLNPAQREAFIIDRLLKQGYVLVTEMAAELAVSPSTLRSDLRVLEERGLLRRTHGGATNTREFTRDLSAFYDNRQTLHLSEKLRIGRAAAERIGDGEVIAFSSGSTPLQIARHIPATLPFTAITNDLDIARVLSVNPEVDVYIPGGFLRMSRNTLVGPDAIENLKGFEINQVFLTVTGLDPQKGVTAGHIWNVIYLRELIKRSQRCVLVADSSKLENPLQIVICPWQKVDVWITDGGVPAEVIQRVEAQGVSVEIV